MGNGNKRMRLKLVENKKKKTAWSLIKKYKRDKNFSSINPKRWTLGKTPEGGNKKGKNILTTREKRGKGSRLRREPTVADAKQTQPLIDVVKSYKSIQIFQIYYINKFKTLDAWENA